MLSRTALIVTLDGFGFDFEGLLETSILAGRWFNMALDFLGAGAGGARIFLHFTLTIHFTLTKSRTVALTKLSIHTLVTLSDQFHCWSGGWGGGVR